jgi:hypothetical protein
MMSAAEVADEMMMCCAACGMAEDGDIKLKKCNACKSVRYCSVKCQRDHRPQHKTDCKKRAADLRDEILFKQPKSSHLGDCPICCLPLRIDGMKSTMYSCCSKMICDGCGYANQTRAKEEMQKQKCPFCRHPVPKTQKEIDRNMMKRIEVNDPVIIQQMGRKRYVEMNYDGAFQYWAKAAGLGDIEAHFNLSLMYRKGEGFEKDKKKELHHLEEAAIGGLLVRVESTLCLHLKRSFPLQCAAVKP